MGRVARLLVALVSLAAVVTIARFIVADDGMTEPLAYDDDPGARLDGRPPRERPARGEPAPGRHRSPARLHGHGAPRPARLRRRAAGSLRHGRARLPRRRPRRRDAGAAAE